MIRILAATSRCLPQSFNSIRLPFYTPIRPSLTASKTALSIAPFPARTPSQAERPHLRSDLSPFSRSVSTSVEPVAVTPLRNDAQRLRDALETERSEARKAYPGLEEKSVCQEIVKEILDLQERYNFRVSGSANTLNIPREIYEEYAHLMLLHLAMPTTIRPIKTAGQLENHHKKRAHWQKDLDAGAVAAELVADERREALKRSPDLRSTSIHDRVLRQADREARQYRKKDPKTTTGKGYDRFAKLMIRKMDVLAIKDVSHRRVNYESRMRTRNFFSEETGKVKTEQPRGRMAIGFSKSVVKGVLKKFAFSFIS